MEKRIMVVDDIPTASIVVRRLLGKLGFTNIVECESGEKAYARLRTDKIDLIICDLHLGDMSAVELLHRIKSDPSSQPPAFIIMTSDLSGEELRSLQQAGASAYILKPIELENLRSKVETTLGKHIDPAASKTNEPCKPK